jgi:hypothetical protein
MTLIPEAIRLQFTVRDDNPSMNICHLYIQNLSVKPLPPIFSNISISAINKTISSKTNNRSPVAD